MAELTRAEVILLVIVAVLVGVGLVNGFITFYLHGTRCRCKQCETYKNTVSGQWNMVGSARLNNISPLGKVELPLEEAVMPNGMYRYRAMIGKNQYLYFSGSKKAYDGMGKSLYGNQPIPYGYAGHYILKIKKEGIPSGFRLPGYKNIGRAAEVMISGKTGTFKYILQGRQEYLNPSKYEYRVILPTLPVPTYVRLLDDRKLRSGETVTPVPSDWPPRSLYPPQVSYGPSQYFKAEPVGFKVMLKDN